jgi:hypothetical protein
LKKEGQQFVGSVFPLSSTGSKIGLFFSQLAKHTDLAVALSPLWDRWIPQYLLGKKQSIRDNAQALITSLFTIPETQFKKELQHVFHVLIDNSGTVEKTLRKYTSSDCDVRMELVPVKTYFGILHWITSAGSFQSELIEAFPRLMQIMETAARCLHRPLAEAILSFFLESIGPNIFDNYSVPKFFDIIAMVSSTSFIQRFLPFVPREETAKLVQSSAFQLLVQNGFSSSDFADFVFKCLDACDWKLIAQAIWSHDVVAKNLRGFHLSYVRTSWRIIKKVPDSANAFYENSVYEAVWREGIPSNAVHVQCLKLLGIFNHSFARLKKDGKRFLSFTPMRKKLADFYKKHGFSMTDFLRKAVSPRQSSGGTGRSGYFHFIFSMAFLDDKLMTELQQALFDVDKRGTISQCEGLAKMMCKLAADYPIPKACRCLLNEFECLDDSQFGCIGVMCDAFMKIGRENRPILEEFKQKLAVKVRKSGTAAMFTDKVGIFVLECCSQDEAQVMFNAAKDLIARELRNGRRIRAPDIPKMRDRVLRAIAFFKVVADKFGFAETTVTVPEADVRAIVNELQAESPEAAVEIMEFCEPAAG